MGIEGRVQGDALPEGARPATHRDLVDSPVLERSQWPPPIHQETDALARTGAVFLDQNLGPPLEAAHLGDELGLVIGKGDMERLHAVLVRVSARGSGLQHHRPSERARGQQGFFSARGHGAPRERHAQLACQLERSPLVHDHTQSGRIR